MRGTSLLLLFGLAACASVLLASDGASSSLGDWTVTSTVVLEEESLLMDGNITVVEGGLLEVRGTAITFNCSYPGQYVLAVQRGGGLVVTTSATGRGASIRPADPSAPTVVRVERAETLRLEGLLVESLGYFNPQGINEIYPAISISDVDGPVVRRCTFRACINSLYLSTCANAILEDNTIEDSEGYGIEVYRLTASRVEGNSVSGTSTGISCLFSDRLRLSKNVVRAPNGCIVVSGCDEVVVDGGELWPEGGVALHVDSSKLVRVRGMYINGSLDPSGGSDGLVLASSSTATVSGSIFEDLEHGVRVVNNEKFSPPYHFLSDNRFLSCLSGVVLASSNNTLVRNSFSDCLLGVRVTDEINPHQPQRRAGASGNKLLRNTFVDCRLAIDLHNATETMIEGCSFVGGVADLVATASTRTREVDGLHTSWEGTAVRVVGGDYRAENVSLLSGPTGFRLEGGASGRVEQSRLDTQSTSVLLAGGSVLDLVNTSHPRRYDVDGTSRLRVWWDVEVETAYESGGSYRIPGTLDIRNREEGGVGSYYCMPSGLPVSVVVLELELEGVTEYNWTPHSFTVTTSERGCSATVGIYRFTKVLLLLDDVAPTIEVEAPQPGGLNRSLVWFSGRAADGALGPAAFVVRIDGADSFSGCGTWAREVLLEDGSHAVTYVATDGSGNVATFRSELLVDTTPPDLVVTEPETNETLTSAISIRVAGRVTGHRLLLLDGEEVPVNGTRFEFILWLDRDGEHTLRLVALDWFDNSAIVTLRVIRDTVAPFLELVTYEPLTREVTVLMGGSTDRTGARVNVNGEVVNILPGGRFSVFLHLLEGPNGFLFRALDETGNEAHRWANITLDTATTLRVISPLDNTTFEVQDIEIVVLTEPGASVRFAGQGWREADADGYWRAEVAIMEGTTILKLEAMDAAGNEATAAVTVHYRPPPVEPVEEDFLPMVVAILAFSAVVALLVLRMRRSPPR